MRPGRRLVDECEEDLASFIDVLHTAGVRVRRPEVPDHVHIVRAPYWEAPAGHAMMPRDIFLVVGDEIIETSPQVRSRYFESDLYKELLTEYFRGGAQWVVAPRSRLQDRNFDYAYARMHGYDGPIPEDLFYEIMFDGAQALRFGNDIIVNISNENHRLGATWLERHLTGSGRRVHTIQFTDNHIDGEILPLHPGLLLVHRGNDVSLLPKGLRDWDVIYYDWLDKPVEVESDGVPMLASQSIGMNVLSLRDDLVVVQDIQTALISDLERAGIDVIPVRWRHGRTLGGGFHCMTLDIRRAGPTADYF
jgi:glycine amidinotransferase